MPTPTKYTPELLEKAQEYLDTWEELGDAVPMLVGMSIHCGITEKTRMKYEKEHEAMGIVCAGVREAQQQVLINKGLTKIHDNSLTKLMLMKHGFTDKQTVDMKSSDGSMSPTKEALDAAREAIDAEFGGDE